MNTKGCCLAIRNVTFALAIDEPRLMPQFHRIRGEFATPEDIDDGLQNAPSKRVAAAFASYDKVLHGVLAAKSVGIAAMRPNVPTLINGREP